MLARLLARTDQLDEALETLDAVAEPSAELHRLVGRLQLRAGRWDEAVAALDRAAEATDDPEVLESIHKERGQAHLAAGDREKAAEAFRALAAIDPGSFHLRLEAATELAWHGLAEEVLDELAVADQLAGDDASKRCRVLSEIGRLHERLGQGDQAVATYREALARLARGHWLKRDLHERILAVHQRAGTVDELIETSRADAADASDLDARELLARALVLSERREEARDVLTAAATDFPSDLELSQRLLEVIEALGDDDGRIAEYQRILGERPEELELYLELGRVFAGSGRFEQARRQWNATLEQRLDDAGLCVRLAGMYALFDQIDDARARYEQAIALEPREVRHYTDLAAFLAVRGLRDEVPAVLERADAAAQGGGSSGGGNASRLSEVASLRSEYNQPERARAALALDPEDAQLKSRLADALLREGSLEQAAGILHEVVETAREAALRNSAVDRIVRQFSRAERPEELLALETAAAEERPEALAPRLVLGKLYVQRREPDLAIGVYEALIEARPQTRRTYLKEIARIHLARYDQQAAFECYDEILRGAPDNAAAFREVADDYDKLGLHDKRLECLRQAARLAPEDARTRLALADAWRTLGEWDRAREEIAEATRVASDEDLGEAAIEAGDLERAAKVLAGGRLAPGGAGVVQAVPSLALLASAITVPGLGLSVRSAILALFLYAVLPILRNTHAGLRGVDAELVEAARAIGLTPGQILLHVRLPLATGTILAGVRTSTVVAVGIATLAAFIGAGGLGEPIVTGLSPNDRDLVLAGALPAALLALGADGLLGLVERRLVPRGLRTRKTT